MSELGYELKYDKDSKKVILSGKLDSKGVDVGVSIELEAEYLLKELAEKIPGKVDDMVLNVVLSAL